MFKLFGKKIAEYESELIPSNDDIKKSRNRAMEFGEDIYDAKRVLSQYFDLSPRVGTYGVIWHDNDNGMRTKITLAPGFCPGFIYTFYINESGDIQGFVCKEDKTEGI